MKSLRILAAREWEENGGVVHELTMPPRKYSRVKRRYSCVCQSCLTRFCEEELSIHHVVFRSQGGTDDEGNLVPLCIPCHRKLHGMEQSVHKAKNLKKKLRTMRDGIAINAYQSRYEEIAARVNCTPEEARHACQLLEGRGTPPLARLGGHVFIHAVKIGGTRVRVGMARGGRVVGVMSEKTNKLIPLHTGMEA